MLNTCPQSRQINLLSDGVNGVAGESAPVDGVVITDEPGEGICVAVEAKLKSVLAEPGVDLLDCGLAVTFALRGEDVLGINAR